MKEYKVTIVTKVKEVYYVRAESAELALDTWSEFDLNHSECEEILDETVEISQDDVEEDYL